MKLEKIYIKHHFCMLPHSILSIIFGSFLQLNDDAIFDSAITSKNIRAVYLDILRHLVVIWDSGRISPFCLRWVHLRQIRLSAASFDEKVLMNPILFEIFPCIYLLKIDLGDLEKLHGSRDRGNQVLIRIVKTLKLLQSFSCGGLLDNGLMALVSYCNSLQELGLYKIDGLSDNSVVYISQYCKRLKHITLECEAAMENKLLYEEIILSIIKSSPSLETLRLKTCCGDGTVSFFVSDKILINLGRYCKNLNRIDLDIGNNDEEAITNNGLEALSESLVKLKHLSISYHCNQPSSSMDKGITKLASTLRYLETLTLCNFSFLTDTAFIIFFQNNPKLVDIEAYQLNLLTDISFSAIQHCQELKRIYLGEMPLLTSLNFQNCLKLETLHLECFPLLSDDSFRSIQHCMKLKKITIWSSPLSDDAVLDIVASCLEIRSIEIWDCDQVTEAGIVHIAAHCKKLTSLKIFHNRFSETSIIRNTMIIICQQNKYLNKENLVIASCNWTENES